PRRITNKEGYSMYTAAVLTISDRCSRGLREDLAGPAVCQALGEAGYAVVHTAILPDEQADIEAALIALCDLSQIPLIVTTGGTGFSPRDVTPEATLAVCTRLAPGIPEAMRAASALVTDRAMLSRGQAGLRGGSLLLNLPGSPKAATENLAAVLPALAHGLAMLLGGTADCAAL
ncbi:MAG: MogA/MoaB family molybdenum cofactor biosynthesis protein, partial [Oscillospiraceae bacterium]